MEPTRNRTTTDDQLSHWHLPNPPPLWYAVQTKPRQESRFIAHLRRRTCDAMPFLPLIEVTRRHARRRLTCLEPLFPSYLFLHMRMTPAAYDSLRWTPGTRRVLGIGEHPVPVPSDLIETLQRRVEPLGFVRVSLRFARGERVRLATGPFAGLEGVFERPTSRAGRVRVLLEFLGTCTVIEVAELDLDKA
jgi:transcriptional antiterminator RfaH